MQATSSLHKALLRDDRHRKEHKVVIAGVTYLQPDLQSLRTYGGAFSEPDIGSCASRQIDLTLRAPSGAIPKRAKIQVYTRLVLDSRASEWLPKGEFFLSTRQTDKLTGSLTIHGYDAMRRAGDVWLTEDYRLDSWPMSQRAAVEDIAARMGVEIDPRTVLSNSFPVGYPVDENGDLTMEDVLEGIAVSNAGNWVMSDEGKLLLLRFGDIPGGAGWREAHKSKGEGNQSASPSCFSAMKCSISSI